MTSSTSSSSCTQSQTATDCRATYITASPSGRPKTTSCFTTTCFTTEACSAKPYTSTSLVSNSTTASSTSSSPGRTCNMQYTIYDMAAEYSSWGAALPFGYAGMMSMVTDPGPFLAAASADLAWSQTILDGVSAGTMTRTGPVGTGNTGRGVFTNSTTNPGGVLASVLGNTGLRASASAAVTTTTTALPLITSCALAT